MTLTSKIHAQNTDLIGHSANFSGAQKESINLAKQGDTFTTEARSAGLVEVQCDDHEWMQAFVHIHPHPFHAVTDSEGMFTIEAVPAGSYKLKVWHERFKERELEVTVKPGQTSRLELEFPKKAPSKKSK
jgi:hypothetical protein